MGVGVYESGHNYFARRINPITVGMKSYKLVGILFVVTYERDPFIFNTKITFEI
jgi:hypothetical protein